jgi:cytochrome c peroxidase
MWKRALFGAALVVWAAATVAATGGGRLIVFANGAGLMGTFSTDGEIDLQNPFFQDLGTNGRRCVSCHQPDSAWTITPGNVQLRFLLTRGTDPIFTNNDGSNCEGAEPRTLAEKRAAYGLLLSRGLIRIGLDVPAGAEFIIDSIRDPYACGPHSNDTSLYRRPLPAANLTFLSAVMWDGRESSPSTTILQDLAQQANDATLGHAQASQALTPAERQAIVSFETALYAAQIRDRRAGDLAARGASGGPLALSLQPFFTGINDPVGLNPTGAPFDPRAFTIFRPWLALHGDDEETRARRSIARGAEVFGTKPITITGVSGLNGQTFPNGVVGPDPLAGTCTTCHDTPNAGDHSVKAPLNIGLTDPSVATYLPVYTLRRIATGETVETTDPGRAMITGKWSDVGRFKGPVLRALAARAPYFHNGSAQTLDEVIDFYENRFHIGLTPAERADLIAFLRSL